MHPRHVHFTTAVYQVNLDQPHPSLSSSSTWSGSWFPLYPIRPRGLEAGSLSIFLLHVVWKRTFWDYRHVFYLPNVLPITQPTPNETKGTEPQPSPTSFILSSPTTGLLTERRCFLGSSMPRFRECITT